MFVGSCGENRILCIAPHPHAHGANIEQHRACGENGILHIKTGFEKQPKHKTGLADQADMCRIRTNSVSIKKKMILP